MAVPDTTKVTTPRPKSRDSLGLLAKKRAIRLLKGSDGDLRLLVFVDLDTAAFLTWEIGDFGLEARPLSLGILQL